MESDEESYGEPKGELNGSRLGIELQPNLGPHGSRKVCGAVEVNDNKKLRVAGGTESMITAQ